jgi:serine O-acetyltransferase
MREQFLVRLHRAGHWCHRRKITPAARAIELAIRLVFGACIPVAIPLGRGVHFSHNGLSVVLNHLCQIGDGCIIGHQVTLGGDGKSIGAPILEAGVVVHPQAMIVGPVRIGTGAVVAAQSFVNRDVPAGALVMGSPARVVEKGAT